MILALRAVSTVKKVEMRTNKKYSKNKMCIGAIQIICGTQGGGGHCQSVTKYHMGEGFAKMIRDNFYQ